MSEQYDRLKLLLLELFQLDKPDLDFGIYRIMHAKAAEVTKFLDQDLLPQVKEALAGYEQGNRSQIEADLAKLIENLTDAGVDPEGAPKVVQLREQLAGVGGADVVEGEVYDLIYRFFSRYYSEGDFISQRRYSSDNTYAIPYNGEEVVLHWANKDQYYIKTSEYLDNYSFVLNPDGDANSMRVKFRLADADEGEHGNVKADAEKGRVFVLASAGESGHDFAKVVNGELVVDFEFRPTTMADWPENVTKGAKPPKQKDVTPGSVAAILSLDGDEWAPWLAGLDVKYRRTDGSESERTKLEVHLDRYAKKNTFDYFIHKDLGEFLRRELDFFIKNEVLHLDDIENAEAARAETYLGKLRAVRRVAGKIIEFLAQLEDFQKKLWLKKKFVVGKSYLVTVGNIDESFHAEICANDAQREEWVELFKIDQQEGDLLTVEYTEPLTPQFLIANPTMTLNTDLFDADFTARLVESASADSLADQVDGLLIHGDNFHALSLLTARLRNEVGCVYADPPYNTDGDGFAYKDSYRHSSWASMIACQAQLIRPLLTRHAAAVTAIGRDEMHRLTSILDIEFGEGNRVGELVWEKGRKNDAKQFSLGHDYMLVHVRDKAALTSDNIIWREDKPGAAEILAEFGRLRTLHGDDHETVQAGIRDFYKSLPKKHPSLTHRRYNRVDANGLWRDDNMSWPGGGGPRYDVPHPDTGKPCVVPDRGWAFSSKERFDLYFDNGFIEFRKDHTETPFLKRYLNRVPVDFDPLAKTRTAVEVDDDGEEANVQVMPSVIYKNQQPSVKELRHILGSDGFKNPKDPEVVGRLVKLIAPDDGLVLDPYAGSGTTGHAVIATNRSEAAERRFVLTEMGEHFDMVLLKRIRRVAFTPEWKDGNPKRLPTDIEANRTPRVIEVVRLESYDDTLNNLALARTDTQQSLLDAAGHEFREQYMLRYQLDVEIEGSASLLTVDAFDNPASYELIIKQPGSDESRPTKVDLIETFNYLIGLTVEGITAPRSFAVETSRDERDRLQIDSLKQAADGTHWFRAVTGTSPQSEKVLVIWRNRPGGDTTDLDADTNTEVDNTVLNHWFAEKQRYSVKDSEFDLIYVNGDNNLENMRRPDEQWKVRRIDDEFHRLMFDTSGMP